MQSGLNTPADLSLKEVVDVHGAEALKKVVEIKHRAEANPHVLRMSELPTVNLPPALPPGISILDEHFKIRQGDFTVVTGIPSHGKSTFINEIAGRMAERHGWSTAFASFEQQPQIDHRRALRTFFGKKRERDQNPREIALADQWIDQHFSFIVPDQDTDVSLEWTLQCAEDAIMRHKVRMVVIDPWNEMDHWRPNGMSLTEYTGYAIKLFRRLARKWMVHVVVAAHPAKQKKNDDGSYSIPTLYDISDSAHWYNKCDLGVVIHRTIEGETLIRVAKSRYHEILGAPGDVKATFNPEINRYMIIEPEMVRGRYED